jgi:ketosteroid isomerase-like protein
MGAKENLAAIEELQQAARDRNWDRYGQLLADDARFRMAGVPQALGGVTHGRDAVVAQMRQNSEATGGDFEVRDIFGDDTHVCVIGKVSAARFGGNEFLKAAEQPFATYECVVYRLAQGRVAESTAYVNWLDVYSQVGLVDPASVTA